jgi:hypothetical protein
MTLRFSATIFKVGINPCVDAPARVSAALVRQGYIPVAGTINGQPFKAGLVSLGNGRHRLYINGEMRKAAGVDTGDRITVILDYDPRPRKLPVPRPFAQALEVNPKAKQVWENLTASRRKEILNYLNNLKSPESLARNITRVIKHLTSPQSNLSVWRK